MTTNLILYNDLNVPGYLTCLEVAQLIPKERSGIPVQLHLSDSVQLPNFIRRALEDTEHDKWVLVTFHSEYFPSVAWKGILEFLKRGFGFVGFGGVPFSRWVEADGERRYQYLEEMGIPLVHDTDVHYFDEYDGEGELSLAPDPSVLFMEERLKLFIEEGEEIDQHEFFGFDLKLSELDENPGESGSSGTLDRTLTPLVHLRNSQRSVACAAWMMDHENGKFKGGRWVVVSWKPPSTRYWMENAKMVRDLVLLATYSATWFLVQPSLGCYLPGETPVVLVSTRTDQEMRIEVGDDKNLLAAQSSQLQKFEVPLEDGAFGPGLHKVEVVYSIGVQLKMRYSVGFWIWDTDLVQERSQDLLCAAGDGFTVGGKPFVVFGTTYMDSRIQRHFLNLPNPARWDADMKEMSDSGVNFIRTGMWWGWGSAGGQEWFRALDGFILTCLRHRLQIQFTFFTFSPHSYRGDHPWQDPRALQGQADWISAVALRYAKVAPLSFDLINEPSYGDPATIFSARPVPNPARDAQKFRKWQHARTGGDLAKLNSRWRTSFASWDEVHPPTPEDLAINPSTTAAGNGFKALDFTLFSYDGFGDWVHAMKRSILGGGSRGLVGVGQDEGRVRLPPQFHDEGDYTTTHPWWILDDLLWDLVIDGVAGVPHLAQEVGVMLTRSDSRQPFRSPEGASSLLERKLYLSLAVGCAGIIQWLWHTNGYMTLDNENSIGLVRVDGSAKPELREFLAIGDFILSLRPFLKVNKCESQVVAIAPYSQWALRTRLGEIPTKSMVRALGYHPKLRIIPQIVNELRASWFTQTLFPKVILLPSLRHLAFSAWEAIDIWVARGANLLVTGVIGLDEYGLPYQKTTSVLSTLLATQSEPRPISRFEVIDSDLPFGTNFDDLAINHIHKHHNQLRVTQAAGKLIWCGIPLELATNFFPMASNIHSLGDFYSWAISLLDTPPPSKGYSVQLTHPKGMDSALVVQQLDTCSDVLALVFVSELGCDAHLVVHPPGSDQEQGGVRLKLLTQRSGAILWHLDSKGEKKHLISLFGGLSFL